MQNLFLMLEAVMTIAGFASFGPNFFLYWIPLSLVLLVIYFYFDAIKKEKEAAKEAAKKAAEEELLVANMSPAERRNYLRKKKKAEDARQAVEQARHKERAVESNARAYGTLNEALFCPHCQTKGHVRTKRSTSITTTSGGVVDSIIAGSKKTRREVTAFHCDNCSTDWEVA